MTLLTPPKQTLSDLLADPPQPEPLPAKIVRARAIQAAFVRVMDETGKYSDALKAFPQRHDWSHATECDVYQWFVRLHTWRARLPLTTRLELEGAEL